MSGTPRYDVKAPLPALEDKTFKSTIIPPGSLLEYAGTTPTQLILVRMDSRTYIVSPERLTLCAVPCQHNSA